MFLPNTDSFVLIRGPIVKPSFPIFLPNTDSFLLRRRKPIIDPSFTPEAGNVVATLSQSTDSEQSKIKDQSKRNFLKVAGIAGASVIASQILSPKKASAFIMGSSPTTGVVGVKDSANARINPATEETVSTLATEATLDEVLKTTDLTFDAGGNLQVQVTSTSGEGSSSFSDSGDVARSGLVDAQRHVQVDVLSSALPTSAATEATLQTISTENTLEAISFGGVQFALRLATDSGDSNIEYLGEAPVGTLSTNSGWRIKKIDSTSGIIIEWPDGSEGFNFTWSARETYTYS